MSFPIKPIGPDEAKRSIPEFVIEAVNELINEKCDPEKRSFIIRQSEVEARIKSKIEQDFELPWLDFEPLYREAGWVVEYDKPCIGDTYEAFYRFTPKRK